MADIPRITEDDEMGRLCDQFVRDMVPHCPIVLPGGWQLTAKCEPRPFRVDLVAFSAPSGSVHLEPPQVPDEGTAREETPPDARV